MTTNIIKNTKWLFAVSLLSLIFISCERKIDELEPATYPVNPEVFIDDFSSGLNYAAFGGSVPAAFDVDNDITYNNSEKSMRFDVPDVNDPLGAYAGGAFFTSMGRDLSSFNALTFWIKATQSASIDVLGFGNDMAESKYQVVINGVAVTTSWKKVIIPLPDPSKLTAERGMLFYSEGPENNKGYSFWIDNVQFEKLGTIAHPRFAIQNGQDATESSFVGVSKKISGISCIYNMPTGIDETLDISGNYFEFTSSDESIATVAEDGTVTVVGGPGTAKITASVNGEDASGSLTIESLGSFQHAPTPTHDAANVISFFSDAYTDVPVDYYNGYWAPYQTTQSADFEINNDHILYYTDFNFVGIQFSAPTVDATTYTHVHIDVYLPYTLTSNASMKLEIVDNAGGGTGSYVQSISVAQSQTWVTIDVPFSSFSGLNSRANLFQIIFSDVNGNISGFYADNIYFYK
jgi:hypothetical protein